MPSGRVPKGPRLWLEPARQRAGRKDNPAVWVIRDGSAKHSTGCGPEDLLGAERALQDYLAAKHQPPKRNSDPSEVLVADVLSLFSRDVVAGYARPKETESRLRRLLGFWGDPDLAARIIAKQKRPPEHLTGTVADVRTATCQAYVEHIGKQRTASVDLELLRAAIRHANREGLLDRLVHVALPEKSMPRERWLTRSEVASLIWLAWRKRRQQDGKLDEWGIWKHLARWMIMAHYTGTRKAAILNASFVREIGRGFIDLDNGLWYRRGEGVRATKKRQPPVPLPAPLLGHLRRWKAAGQRYVVEFHGEAIERIDKAFRLLVSEAEQLGLIAPAAGPQDQVVPHTFRHTAITWGMQNGMDPWDASGYFGLSLQTLLDVYGHHHPNHLRDAADRMARPKRRVAAA